jgi:hypothetical protein
MALKFLKSVGCWRNELNLKQTPTKEASVTQGADTVASVICDDGTELFLDVRHLVKKSYCHGFKICGVRGFVAVVWTKKDGITDKGVEYNGYSSYVYNMTIDEGFKLLQKNKDKINETVPKKPEKTDLTTNKTIKSKTKKAVKTINKNTKKKMKQ